MKSKKPKTEFSLPGVMGYGLDEFGEPDCYSEHNPTITISNPESLSPLEVTITWGKHQDWGPHGLNDVAEDEDRPQPDPVFLMLPKTPEMAACLMRAAYMCLCNED